VCFAYIGLPRWRAPRRARSLRQKASGQRMKLDEIAVFTLAHGKIVREEFFYQMG
jgi:hypothetical protein